MPSVPSTGLVTTLAELARLVDKLISDGLPFGFDIETGYEGEPREGAQLHPEENLVAGFSLTNSVHWARYVPLRHDSGTNVSPHEAAFLLWKLLATGLGVPYHAKFELRTCAAWFVEEIGVEQPGVMESRGYFPVLDDPMIGYFTEGKQQTYALKVVTKRVFGREQAEIKTLFARPNPKWDGTDPAKQLVFPTKSEMESIRFNVLDQHDPAVIAYACDDAVFALAHHLTVHPRVRDHLLYQADMYVETKVLPDMEDEGLCYDWLFMRDGAVRARDFAAKLQVEIQDKLSEMLVTRGHEPLVKLNLNSHAQVGTVLYDQLGMVTRVMTKGGKTSKPKMSTGKIALKGLSQEHPVVKKILNFKSLTRLAGTYLEKYEANYNYASDGRAHPNHMQVVVPTGRFAVGDPPYQQSPKKYRFELASGEVFTFNFRDAIISPPGWYILGFDYSQIELRVIAGEAQETSLLEAFARGDDVHRLTASLMLGKPLSEVTEEDRAIGKTMNFALMYQMGAEGLADRLGCTQDEARRLFDLYFLSYPKIKGWIDRTVAQAKQDGYTMSRFGRRHPIWQFLSGERWQFAEGERAAGNYPIQGGAADYMKIAMVRADKALRAAGLKTPDGKGDVRLVMNIHDALEFYVRNEVPPAKVIRILAPAVVFPVEGWPPIEAEWHLGRRWGSVNEIKLQPDGSIRLKKDEQQVPAGELDGDVDDEEDGGSGQVLPDLPPVQFPVSLPPAHPELHLHGTVNTGVPRTVVIRTQGMPSQQGVMELAMLLKQAPGPHSVVLQTGGGSFDFPFTTGLTPASAPEVSLMLGGAEVHWAPDSQVLAEVAAGIG